MIKNATAASNDGAMKGLQGYNFITTFCWDVLPIVLLCTMMQLSLFLTLTTYVNPFCYY